MTRKCFFATRKKGIIRSKTHKKKHLCNPHIYVFLFMFDTYMYLVEYLSCKSVCNQQTPMQSRAVI